MSLLERIAAPAAVALCTFAMTAPSAGAQGIPLAGPPPTVFTVENPDPDLAGQFGRDVHVVDLDGDQLDEVLIGIPFRRFLDGVGSGKTASFPRAGQVAVLRGPVGPKSLNWTFFREPVGPLGGGGPQHQAEFGFRIESGDFDGDTNVDVVVAAPGARIERAENGEVHVFYGPWSLSSNPPYSRHQMLRETKANRNPANGYNFGDRFGQRMAVGDLNADGHDDLAVGAPFSTTQNVAQGGQAWVLWGAPGTAALTTREEVFHKRNPINILPDRLWGWDLAIGNFKDTQTHQGVPDLAVAAYNRDWPFAGNAGDVVVYFDYPSTNSFSKRDRIQRPGGSIDQYCFGWTMAAGRADRDGFDDLAIAAIGQATPGEVHLIRGGPGFPHRAGGWMIGPYPVRGGRFGGALQWLDQDADPCQELAIGAPTYDAQMPRTGIGERGEGRVFLLDPGTIDPRTPVQYQVFDDPTPNHGRDFRGFGNALAAGFLDVNGNQDLVIGNPRAFRGNKPYVGEVQIIIR